MTAKKVNKNSQSHNSITKIKKRKARYGFMLLGMGVLTLLFLYLYVGYYYQNHFYKNTIINGVNTSDMTVAEAEAAINSQVSTYQLTLQGRNELTDTIYGDSIALHTEFNGYIEDLLNNQKGLAWPASLNKIHEYEIETMLVYDEEQLKLYYDNLTFFEEANSIEPVNASISEYGEIGYEIIPENPGAKILKDKLYESVKNAILCLESSLTIEDTNSYEQPKITTKYPKLVAAINEMNKLTAAEITYEFGDNTEVLDGSRISEWITLGEDFTVQYDESYIKDFVDYIGKTYNSFGRVRKFKTSYGDVLEIKGGDYGWWLDRVTEVAELTELVRSGEKLVRKPAYFQTAQQYGPDDIGDTYVEINLTAQHLFFYKDGKLVLETDFVSGNISKNYGTPVGTYPVQYKDLDATLVGEDYETPVKYWMPFNKNIGLHDASWRSKFGKDIYLKNGSHGCINMPPKMAKKMYQNIERGVAVVVYELPGTENYEVKEKETEQNIDNKDNEADIEETEKKPLTLNN